ncbi:MAG: hypothetical protein KF691_13440 [Phycisphaeraceae bacterium]|nr:hypothetical protein [Phycisphaeraceae bacterium]
MYSDSAEAAAEPMRSEVEGGLSSIERLFDAHGFMPRWQCGDWSLWLGWLHIVSDFLIFVAYACIPLSLMFFALRRRDIALKGIIWLFVAFILSCGLTHLTDAAMFYYPAYRFLGLMKGITAVVSLSTVVALFLVMPTALSLPGIAEAHKIAQREIERCKKAEIELVRTRDELESRGAQLTGRLHKAQQSLAGAESALVHWDAGTGKILWESGLSELIAVTGKEVPNPTSWSEILDPQETASLNAGANAALQVKRNLVLRLPRTDTHGVKRVLEIRARHDRGDPDAKVMIGSMTWYSVGEEPVTR